LTYPSTQSDPDQPTRKKDAESQFAAVKGGEESTKKQGLCADRKESIGQWNAGLFKPVGVNL
jgi:hypothetical protein